jgi:hypothetical protein
MLGLNLELLRYFISELLTTVPHLLSNYTALPPTLSLTLSDSGTYFPINWQTSISFLPCAQTRILYSQMSGMDAEYGLFYVGSICCVDHGSCTGTKVYSLKSGLEAEYNVFYFGYSRGTAVCV